MKLNLVVAASPNLGIGINGTLPWRLKGDMAFFRKLTMTTLDSNKQNAVLMGRKTWDSIPTKFKPLVNRLNIVLSTTMQTPPEGVIVARSLNEALEMLDDEKKIQRPIENVYVIGGNSVYREALESPACHRIYLTNVMKEFDCDVFLPKFDMSDYKTVSHDLVPVGVQCENDIQYEIKVLEKVV